MPRKLSLVVACGILLGQPAASMAAKNTFAPKTFAYLLQADAKKRTEAEALEMLTLSGRDLLIIDYSFDGGRFGKWSASQLNRLRAAKPGRKIVAYISIGEAEDYRSYWQPVWDRDDNTIPDAGAPEFLLPVNPGWSGNYRVKYWHAAWQKIIMRYIDEILLQGFDGLYLDIVDGFQFFEFVPQTNKHVAKRENPESKQSYRQDMVDWVVTVSQHARRKKKDALIIPQNGSQLLEYPEFLQAIDGISLEDFFTEGNRKQPPERVRLISGYLAPLQAAGKPVLLVEYPTSNAVRTYAKEQAKAGDFVLLLTDRKLKTLGYSGTNLWERVSRSDR
jgi:cysteinyl-tRNA synthetase, unknown class